MSRRRWAFGVTAVALVAMAGRGGGGEAAGPSSTSPPVTVAAPTTTVPSEEDAVLAAYQGYWDTWLAANDPPNPDHPDLDKYSTGPALVRDRETIGLHRSVGQRVRLPPNSITEHRARVKSIDGSRAEVADCSIDDGMLIANGSDFVIDDAVVTWRYEATLEFSSRWRVSELRVLDQTDGVSGCAA